MADEEAQRRAHLGESRARQLESDAAARNGDLAETLALGDQADDPPYTPDGDSPPYTPDGDSPPYTSDGDSPPYTPDGDSPPHTRPADARPTAAEVESTYAEAERRIAGPTLRSAAGAHHVRPAPSRWQFWRRRARPKKHKKAPWWELPVLIAVAIAVAVLIKTFLIQPFYIPSESMEKTLHGCPGCSGDRVLVNKLILDIRDPHPGDIVVFRAPANWDEEPTPKSPSNPFVKGVRWFGQLIGFIPPDEKDLIKRVIAVGGQTVQCCDSQGRVQVSTDGANGPWHSLDEPYIFQDSPWDPRDKPGHIVSGSADQRTFGPVTVPKGRLWVMGDHRGDSADSRFHCIEESPADHVCQTTDTTVAVNKVIGKAVLIAWPPSRWRTLGTPPTFKQLADAAMPALGGALVVLPVFGVRRRRRLR